MTIDERINRLAEIQQEQSALLASHIQITHDTFARTQAAIDRLVEQSAKHEDRIAKIEAALERLVEQSAKHEGRITKIEGAIARLEASVSNLVEESLRTERRWQAYLNTLPKQ
jgi:septal ring factor EnvC (AmiA/AmiB activator)